MPITDADLVAEVKATPLDDVAIAPRMAAQSVRRERVPPVKAATKAQPARRKERHPYFGGHNRRR